MSSGPSHLRPPHLDALAATLAEVENEMQEAVRSKSSLLDTLHPAQKISALNLIRYLSLRSRDIRSLQDDLHVAGLSSLASSESHILRQLQAVRQRLGVMYTSDEIAACDYHTGRGLLRERSEALFGTKKDGAVPFLMVTFDTHFADNFKLITQLLEAGMNVARINCAHDDEETWQNMIGLIRLGSKKTGLPCKVYMDISGPKMRSCILGKGKEKGRVKVSAGEHIFLAEREADFSPDDKVIGCDEPGVIAQLKPGDRVLFDDGTLESQVMSNRKGIAHLEITRVSMKKPRIRAEKGINFPDSQLDIPALTDQDLGHLPFIAENADLIGYSFARSPEGIAALQARLDDFPRRPQIVLKVETPQAVRSLPDLLIQGMHDEVFGVMIARGDLAVEIGFERMSEIQEEIVWICEAAHAPVIWATQVLESLNKSGLATRAEVTDAAYAAKAECVMINKGDYVLDVLRTLQDILRRMGAHRTKKRYTFRPMQIARDFLNRD